MTSPTVTAVSERARYSGDWYFCWLIEWRDGPQPRWLGEYTWVTDANDAIWYARKSDAEAVCDHDLKGVGKVVVCEHGFAIEARSALSPSPAPVTAVSDELLLPFLDEMSKHANWCRKNVSDAANCTCPAEAAQHEAAAIRKRVAELLRARSALADVGRCPYCDNSGDVHRADGEYLGKCPDCTGKQPRPSQQEAEVSQRVAQQIIRVRAALIVDDNAEANHQLYKIASPNFDSLTPWGKLEALAGFTTDSLLDEALAAKQAEQPRPAAEEGLRLSRIGPNTPDNSMVICPHCTSQFQAVSVDDQKRRNAFEAATQGRRPLTRYRVWWTKHGVEIDEDVDGDWCRYETVAASPAAHTAQGDALIGTIDSVLKNHPRPLPVELLEDCKAELIRLRRLAEQGSAKP